jgi:Family of unknown function (DUF5824)
MKKQSVPLKYVPQRLSRRDRSLVIRELKKSRRLYKSGVYYTRKKIKSYPKKTSPHILKAKRIYKVENVLPSLELSRRSGCSISALNAIVRKGEGAYFSSGSRPNQTAHSWGYARLGSAITGGKSSVIDFHIIEKGCKHSGKAYKLALDAKRVKRRHTQKTNI